MTLYEAPNAFHANYEYDLNFAMVKAAVEIDNKVLDSKKELGYVKELSSYLKKYETKEEEIVGDLLFYNAFANALGKDQKESFSNPAFASQISLDLKLLTMELDNLPKDKERLKELSSFLCNFSDEYGSLGTYYDEGLVYLSPPSRKTMNVSPRQTRSPEDGVAFEFAKSVSKLRNNLYDHN